MYGNISLGGRNIQRAFKTVRAQRYGTDCCGKIANAILLISDVLEMYDENLRAVIESAKIAKTREELNRYLNGVFYNVELYKEYWRDDFLRGINELRACCPRLADKILRRTKMKISEIKEWIEKIRAQGRVTEYDLTYFGANIGYLKNMLWDAIP